MRWLRKWIWGVMRIKEKYEVRWVECKIKYNDKLKHRRERVRGEMMDGWRRS